MFKNTILGFIILLSPVYAGAQDGANVRGECEASPGPTRLAEYPLVCYSDEGSSTIDDSTTMYEKARKKRIAGNCLWISGTSMIVVTAAVVVGSWAEFNATNTTGSYMPLGPALASYASIPICATSVIAIIAGSILTVSGKKGMQSLSYTVGVNKVNFSFRL